MSILKEYLHYHDKYTKIYGEDNTIVLMMVGSFYEAYAYPGKGPDLEVISEILDAVLTRKNKSIIRVDEKNPYLVGFPCVAWESNSRKLIGKGYTIIKIDQVTPPPDPRREVTEILSPGTNIENLTSNANYIVSLFIEEETQKGIKDLVCVGMSALDVSTGKSLVHEAHSVVGDESYGFDETIRFLSSCQPKELIIFHESKQGGFTKEQIIQYLDFESKSYHYVNKIPKTFRKVTYQQEFLNKIYKNTQSMLNIIEFLDLENKPYTLISLMGLLDFVFKHNQDSTKNLMKPEVYELGWNLTLGNNAIFQLNVIDDGSYESQKRKIGSIFDVLNMTSTPMGKRYLKHCLCYPLIQENEINFRYDAVEETFDFIDIYEMYLRGITDIERLHRRLGFRNLHPYQFVNLMDSYTEISNLITSVQKSKIVKKKLPDKEIIKHFEEFIKICEKKYNFEEMKKINFIKDISESFYKKGVHPEIDKLSSSMGENIDFMNNIISELSKYIVDKGKSEKKISLLHNRQEGYYLKLSKKRAELLQEKLTGIDEIKITENFSLKPSEITYKYLKNDAKIFFDELSNKSSVTVDQKDKIVEMVTKCYLEDQRFFYETYRDMFYKINEFVSIVDFYKSCAKVAKSYNYCKPVIQKRSNGFINVKQLRHPIIERIRTEVEYVPHDIRIGKEKDDDENYLNGMLVYGLNSAGKSSLQKSIGLSVIMAQSGMFVPASEFTYSPYETLFARMTGSDNIFKGLSSFALEMTELNAILKRSAIKTLVIGDEVCRGTEHISGNAIVAASIVKLSESGSTFIFATHLHEIAEMDRIKALSHVKPFHLTVEHDKEKDILIFDRKLKPGPGEPVYGLTVAKFIIKDKEFIKMAQEIQNEMLKIPNCIVNDKTSNFSSEVYMDECGICNRRFEKTPDHGYYFETHHINHQKDCKNGFITSKPYVPMNNKSNLVVLCKDCHHKTHHGTLEINGYIDTSIGRQIVYKDKEKTLAQPKVSLVKPKRNNIKPKEHPARTRKGVATPKNSL